MSVKDYNMLAFDLRVDSGKVKSVIEDFGLFAFTDDGKCFYSESLMRRMKIKDVKSEKARQSAKSRWNKSERTANAPDNGCERTANAPKSDAIKVKESKEDNDKSSSSKGEDAVADELKKQVEDYKKREIWLTDMSMKFHITPEGIRKHLDEFYLDMRCREIKIQKLPGVFIPWLSDKLQRKSNERANNNAKKFWTRLCVQNCTASRMWTYRRLTTSNGASLRLQEASVPNGRLPRSTEVSLTIFLTGVLVRWWF